MPGHNERSKPSDPKAGVAPVGGRRELNKADKLQRIRDAASALFKERGFDATTMREIATQGGVGFGTIFDYATDKRDLLFLIFNPELVRALDEGHEAARGEKRFIDKLMKLFESFYRLYHQEPVISRFLLRELNFYSSGIEARKFMQQRADFLGRLAGLVADAQSQGVLLSRERPEMLAQILFSMFAWEVRSWLSSDDPGLSSGLARLRRLLKLQITGFGPVDGAV